MIDYEVMETVSEIMAVSGLTSLLSTALGIACYILSGIALYSIAKRRGVNHTWMAWVPIVNDYLLGSISDHYHYVVKGENKSKRKVLLVLSIIYWVAYIVYMGLFIGLYVNLIQEMMSGFNSSAYLEQALSTLIAFAGVAFVLFGVAVALIVVRYVALYDVYTSLDPKNKVLYLVLSIFISVTEPFFIFCNRKKDLGMPPRTDAPVYQQIPQPRQPAAEPWENNTNS